MAKETVMKIALGVLTGALLMATALGSIVLLANQNAGDTPPRADASAGQSPDAHVALARTAAGDTYGNLFKFLCTVPGARAGGSASAEAAADRARGGGARSGGAPGQGRGPAAPERSASARAAPDRSTWYAEPVKVFDNLYFVGQREYSAWAVTTSEGIILIDTLFDYSVEDEIVGGLKKLGLDPAAIRYAVVTHPHPDHHGGAKLLQDRYGTRVVMSAADWDVIDRLGGTKPARDIVATDAQRLTLGDTTVTLYITPGHTPGTLSMLIPVRDSAGQTAGAAGGGKPHLAALWGGTGLNADRDSLQAYVRSAQRFGELARAAGADIILSNHTDWDGTKAYLPRLAARASGSAHPYVVGTPAVSRYLTVAEECAAARLLRLKTGN
jgi:metallo-beta-lactamase class B